MQGEVTAVINLHIMCKNLDLRNRISTSIKNSLLRLGLSLSDSDNYFKYKLKKARVRTLIAKIKMVV